MNNNVIIFNNIKSLDLRYKNLNEQIKEINNSLKNDLITNKVESYNIVCKKSLDVNEKSLFIDDFKNINIENNTIYIDNHKNININNGLLYFDTDENINFNNVLLYLDKDRNININNQDIYINNVSHKTLINHNLNIKNNLIYIDDNININNENIYINNTTNEINVNYKLKINENPLIFKKHHTETDFSEVKFNVINKNGYVYLKISSSINEDFSDEKVCYIDITNAFIISSI